MTLPIEPNPIAARTTEQMAILSLVRDCVQATIGRCSSGEAREAMNRLADELFKLEGKLRLERESQRAINYSTSIPEILTKDIPPPPKRPITPPLPPTRNPFPQKKK